MPTIQMTLPIIHNRQSTAFQYGLRLLAIAAMQTSKITKTKPICWRYGLCNTRAQRERSANPMLDCEVCGNHKLSYIACSKPNCPNLLVKIAIEHDITCGPNDFFEISSNNSPDIDPSSEDDCVIEPF